jgi:hypothetical protein
MPSTRETREFKMLSEKALRDFQIFCAAGRFPVPDKRAAGAFDEKRRGYDYSERDTEEPDYPRTRKAAAGQPAGERTEEASGLDDDLDGTTETGVPKISRQQAQELWKMIEERGFTRDSVQDCLKTMMREGSADEDPEEQETVSSGSMTGPGADPSRHLMASAPGDKRKGMDSLDSLYRAGRLSTRDYERYSEERRRYGKPSAAAAASFARMWPDAARIRNSY